MHELVNFSIIYAIYSTGLNATTLAYMAGVWLRKLTET